jgi:hypothetical protein
LNRTATACSLRVGGLALLCALSGIVVFGVLAWRAITVEDASRAEAERRIASVRAGLPSKTPLIDIDAQGRALRIASPREGPARPVKRLKALAWRAADQRLVTADTPFWFLKLKGPAARYALAETGFDLTRLGLTPADIERVGPAVIVDHASHDGSRLLVWTE